MKKKRNKNIIDKICNLLTVKSLVTLILTGAFTYLSVTRQVSQDHFMTVFTTVIAFYFGTQYQKSVDEKDGENGEE